MAKRNKIVFALIIAVLAFLFESKQSSPSVPEVKKSFRPGKNNTVLFLTNNEHGLRNAILATSSALLTGHPDVEVHIGSFDKLHKRVQEIEQFARRRSPLARSIKFHVLPGLSYGDRIFTGDRTIMDMIHPPGFAGVKKFADNIPMFFMPWTGQEYLDIYEAIERIFDEVDPAIVAVDPALGPAVDAVQHRNRNYVVLSTNTLKENAAAEQGLAMLWKYPVFGSGYEYPVPWRLIPANIFLNLWMGYRLLTAPHLKERTEWLSQKGLNVTTPAVESPCQRAPLCITQSLIQAEFPLVVPDKFRAYGPIVMSMASAAEQDPELAAWLGQRPTILINMGSVFTWTEHSATQMARALKTVMNKMDVQVLWKLSKREAFSDDVFLDLSSEIQSNRVRVTSWIKADPTALMETGHIAIAVHHGGASSFFEPLSAGVPQLLLPHWADCYDFATRAELAGVGVWGNKKKAPELDTEELIEAFLTLLGDDEKAEGRRRKAKEIGEICQKEPGKDLAAREIAGLARHANS